jgi:preprotein translocase subunit SecE
MESIRLYIKESYMELVNKVTWPTWPNLLSSAYVVLIATAIISLIVFVLDAISNGALDAIYKM